MSISVSYEGNYDTSAPLETRIGLHQQFSINPHGWHRWMLDHLDLVPGLSIVELGCGTGDLWSSATKAKLDGIKLYLFDKSTAMLESATSKLQSIADVHFDTIDLDDEFYLPRAPDVVIANHVLYHTKDPHSTLTRLHGQINDSTQCIFATNGIRSMSSLSRFLPERFLDSTMLNLIANFTLESGYQHVRRVFGSVQTVRYADALHITDAAPLVEYIDSLPWVISSDELDEISNSLADHIRDYGSLYIEKDTGFLSNVVSESAMQ